MAQSGTAAQNSANAAIDCFWIFIPELYHCRPRDHWSRE
jgi:hypothetical protein